MLERTIGPDDAEYRRPWARSALVGAPLNVL